MADTLVGGAILSATLQVLFDRIASRQVADFFREDKVKNELLEKLNLALKSVNVVLDDAEDKQITHPNVKSWLAHLKDAVYDAEDLLDEIATEALGKSHISFSKLFKEGEVSKLEKILGRLEYLASRRDTLGLKEHCRGRKALQRSPETSLVDESCVYGRCEDKEAIMKLLDPKENPTKNQIDVIPIVGLGGVGKTTLAQLIYNDNRVLQEGWFDLKAWVCVSEEELDVFRVTKDILQELGVNCESILTPNRLHVKLKEQLLGNRFLFVLDNVSVEKYDDWQKLKSPFYFGAENSKIIVTTRYEGVASIVRTVPTFHLNVLSDENCWKLFARHAFVDGDPRMHPDLKVIGEAIAKRCSGLPLAAITLGGLLRFELDANEWSKILKSNLWDIGDHILPSLRVSYYYLPSHLKCCFAYCSIFPKGYEFEKEELVRLWMAEGLLEFPKEYDSAEEKGNKNFRDLTLRSFFHPLKSGFVMHDLISALAKSVAGELYYTLDANDDSCGITKRTRHLSNVQEQYDMSEKFKTLQEAKSLRTFLTLKSSLQNCYVTCQMPKLMIKSTCLRVLSLAKYDNIFELPEKIDELKLLRYLDLTETQIKCLPNSLSKLLNMQTLLLFRCLHLVELPKDMRRLINLQHLDIRQTQLARMPEGMGELKDLRTLTDFALGKKNGSRITELGKLKHLGGRLAISGLENIGCGKDAKKANLKDKMNLTELELIWSKGYGFHDDSQVLELLEPHTKLERLLIKSYRGERFPEGMGRWSFSYVVSLELRDCIYCVCLPPLGQLSCLKSLSIEGFASVVKVGANEYYDASSEPFRSLEILSFVKMQNWEEWICSTDGGAFCHLQELKIADCPGLTRHLPKHLPSLKRLEVKDCEKLQGSLPTAPSICELELLKCDALELEPLPCGLRKLRIDNSNINDFTLGQMVQNCTLLEELTMAYCSDLGSYRLPTIADESCHHPLERFQLGLFPMLNRLRFSACHDLKSIGALQWPHECLNTLQINGCPNFESFEIERGLSATNLTSLELCKCKNLRSLPEHMHSLFPSLVDLKINDCPEIVSFPKKGLALPLKLKAIGIEKSDKLIGGMIRREWSLPTLTSLTYLSISGPELEVEREAVASEIVCSAYEQRVPDVLIDLVIGFEDLSPTRYPYAEVRSECQSMLLECFPDQHLLPSSLTHLRICDFPFLKQLNGEGFLRLTSLRDLHIHGCSSLKSISAESFPHSLSYLCIRDCPLLEIGRGKDRPNIPFIRNNGQLNT